MSNDQQAVVKRTITHSYYDPMHASIAREIVEASDYDKLAARLAEAEGREKEMRGTLLAISHNANRSMTDKEAKETLTNLYAMVEAALSTEEKP